MLITEIAEFAARLTWDQLPVRTQALARCQLAGWLGSVAAGRWADEAPGILSVAAELGGGGQAAVWPLAHPKLGRYGAAYASAALSCAHDFDDYLFLAHTGHSACGVPWTEAQVNGASVRDVLVAMVAANEVMGRLGAACLVGPQNGQLWTFVHLAGACLGAGRLLRRDAGVLAAALATAFFQPPMALWPGFRGAAKLLSAATPTLLGRLALDHAERGMGGALDVLEGRGGFFERFAALPLADVFDDLGSAWVTDSLSVKPVPGCAYVTAAAEAALACAHRFAAQHERPLEPAEVEAIEVRAGPLTLAMERLLGGAAGDGAPSPVAVNFSARWSVAAALLHGRLDPQDLTREALSTWAQPLAALAGRTRVRLDRELALDLVREVGLRTGLWRRLRRRGWLPLARGLAAAVRAAPGVAERASGPDLEWDLAGLAGVLRQGLRGGATGDEGSPYDLAFPFGAAVRVRLLGGAEISHRVRVPDGAAGSGLGRIREVARDKLAGQGTAWVRAEELAALARELVEGRLDEVAVADVVARVGGPQTQTL